MLSDKRRTATLPKYASRVHTTAAIRAAVLASWILWNPMWTGTAPTVYAQRHRQAFPTVDQLPAGIYIEAPLEIPQPRTIAPRAASALGLQLTKRSEGFRPALYNDAAHYCTIAYGHLVKKQPCDGTEPVTFRSGVSEAEGSNLLVRDMGVARRAVEAFVNIDLTDAQYGALCDFVFNVGVRNFEHSTLLQAINDEDADRVPPQFRRWVAAGGKKLPGLVRRREKEIALFFQGSPIPKGLPPEGEDTSLIDIRTGERP